MSKKDSKSDCNGDNLASSIRLTKTFSKPTDLLLSNSKNNLRAQNSKKNNYAPNLNVVRNKNLELPTTSERDPKKDANNRTRNQRGKNAKQDNNNKGNKPKYIQQMGFLSEGIAESTLKKHEHSRGLYSKESGGTIDMMQKPRLNKNALKHNKEDLEKELKTLSSLLEENDIDSDESKTYHADEINPVKINHINNSCSSEYENQLKAESLDIKVKNEGADDINSHSSPNGSPEIKIEPGMRRPKTEYFHRMDKLFHPDANQVVLFQMPDTLPQKLPEEDIINREHVKGKHAKARPFKLSSLEHFNEGLIGKLIRYRSGKTKLMIGDYMYDVDTAIPTEFRQNAVSISSNPQQRSANMYSLGEIHAKYHIIPDWNWFFDRIMKDS